jgi:exonuclease III
VARVFALYRWVGVKNLVQENEICIDTWNIEYLTRKLMEIIDIMTRRSIVIVCFQETKWVDENSRETKHIGSKLWYKRKKEKREIEMG